MGLFLHAFLPFKALILDKRVEKNTALKNTERNKNMKKYVRIACTTGNDLASPSDTLHFPILKEKLFKIPANATPDQITKIADEVAQSIPSLKVHLPREYCISSNFLVEVFFLQGNKLNLIFQKKYNDAMSYMFDSASDEPYDSIRAAVFAYLTDPARGV